MQAAARRLGNADSAPDDSFGGGSGPMAGLLEGPAYTRPRVWRGREVPPVLLSGDHAAIARWRRDAALRQTAANRPDLAARLAAVTGRRSAVSIPAIVRYSLRLAFLSAAKIWQTESAAPHMRPSRCVAGRLAPWTPRDRISAFAGVRVMRTRGTAAMHTAIAELEQAQIRSDIPDFRPGDTLKVHVRVVEGSRSRIQVFQGVVLRRQGGGARETFTVRKISYGVGVERTFPVHSPSIDKIEVVTRGRVRRAKLYYLRSLRGKAARIKERREPAR